MSSPLVWRTPRRSKQALVLSPVARKAVRALEALARAAQVVALEQVEQLELEQPALVQPARQLVQPVSQA